MARVLVLGDPHLGKGQNISKQSVGSMLNTRVSDQFKILEWVYDQAVDRNISHIVITGDVFDEPKPHFSLIAMLIEWLHKCADYDIGVHIIVGNHDTLRNGSVTISPLDIVNAADIPGVHVYKDITSLHLNGMSITLVPFRDRRYFDVNSNAQALAMLASPLGYECTSMPIDNKKVLIGHLAIQGAIPVGNELDDMINELYCPPAMFDSYDYVWMGHVHKFQVLQEKPYVAHIGSMDISDFGEADHNKYIALLSTDNEDFFEYLRIPTRQLKHVTITLPETEVNVSKFIEQELAREANLDKAIVKVSLVLPTSNVYSIDRTAIEKTLYDNGAFFVSKVSEERKFTSVKKKMNETMDSDVSETAAIKTYAKLVEDHIRDDFMSMAFDIVKECKEK